MPSSWMLRRVVLVRIDVSEERSTSIIMVSRIGEQRTALTVTSNRSTLQRNIISIRATRRNNPEDGIGLQHYTWHSDVVIHTVALSGVGTEFLKRWDLHVGWVGHEDLKTRTFIDHRHDTRIIPSSGMLCHATLVSPDDSEERIAFIIRVTRIGELGTTSAVFLDTALRLIVTLRLFLARRLLSP
jgi:hypothetical protein